MAYVSYNILQAIAQHFLDTHPLASRHGWSPMNSDFRGEARILQDTPGGKAYAYFPLSSLDSHQRAAVCNLLLNRNAYGSVLPNAAIPKPQEQVHQKKILVATSEALEQALPDISDLNLYF